MPRKPNGAPWSAGGDSVAARPELAVKIAVVANTWTSIEGHMAYALGSMIGSDDKVALAILSKVQTATQKSQMIRAIGKAALDPRFLPELTRLLASFEALAIRRNKVIHGLWGIMESEPDGLLWVPPSAPHRISLGLVNAMVAGNPMELIQTALAEAELWEAPDFDDLNADLARLASDSVAFAVKMQGVATAKACGLNVDELLTKVSGVTPA